METRRMHSKASMLFLTLFVSAVCAFAQFAPVPKALQESYVTTDPAGMKVKIGFRLERGKLSVDREWSNGKTGTLEVLFKDLVAVSTITPPPWGKWSVLVQHKSSGSGYILFNTKEDALSVAKYLSDMSGASLASEQPASPPAPAVTFEPKEIINERLWNPALCPPGARPSCASFQELLDHNDPEIVRYTNQANTGQVYACFSTEGADRFFVLQMDAVSRRAKEGFVWISTFDHGVEEAADLYGVRWLSNNFSALYTFGEKRSEAGIVNNSEIDLRTTFVNKIGTQTQYKMAIRWSTRKYIQQYLWKNEKGVFQSDTQSGACVQLH